MDIATNPASSSQERKPWKNSQRLRIAFQSAGGRFGSHRLVARLIGTLKITVEINAAVTALAASQRHTGTAIAGRAVDRFREFAARS